MSGGGPNIYSGGAGGTWPMSPSGGANGSLPTIQTVERPSSIGGRIRLAIASLRERGATPEMIRLSSADMKIWAADTAKSLGLDELPDGEIEYLGLPMTAPYAFSHIAGKTAEGHVIQMFLRTLDADRWFTVASEQARNSPEPVTPADKQSPTG